MKEYNLVKKYLATRFERANPVAEIKQIYNIISKKKMVRLLSKNFQTLYYRTYKRKKLKNKNDPL